MFIATGCTPRRAALIGAIAAAVIGALLVVLAPSADARLWTNGRRGRRHGFPTYYQDMSGLRLGLCLNRSTRCTSPKPFARPARVPGNFPEETFWWSAEAQLSTRGDGRARLVMAVEAAFLNEVPRAGDQVSFGRVRVRADRLVPRRRYRITYPYGRLRLRADREGMINFTRDIGCERRPCRFARALRSGLGPTLLRWDPNRRPTPPAGYIGNPAAGHRVVGSPRGTNFFRIRGPRVGGRGDRKIMTRKFAVEGRKAEIKCTIRGTKGRNRIEGTAGDDVICAGRGRDVIVGQGGRDTLVGGPGRDKLAGGRGDDDLRGAGDVDRLRGGRGRDILLGGGGGDSLIGARGRDLLRGEHGPDRVRARDHRRDRVFGGSGRDVARMDGSDRATSVERPLRAS